MTDRLLVSFVVVALNAEGHLPLLLSDLLAQNYPMQDIEAVLVDSASTDGTRQIMEDFARRAPFPVQVLSNPKGWLASGCNIALSACHGNAVVRLDAHARIPADFLSKSAAALARGEDIAGGSVQSAEPQNDRAAVLRALDASRFCGGAAPFRNDGKARYVDTLAYGLVRKAVYDAVGPYDERLRRTEDNDMHYRMREAGYRFYFTPEIRSTHAARDTLSGQLRQKWGNGYWIGRTMRIQPRCFAPRHLIPMVFTLALLACLILLPLSPWPLLLLLLAYCACDLFFTAQAAKQTKRAKLQIALSLPFLFPLMHLAYGVGTLAGLLTPEARHA